MKDVEISFISDKEQIPISNKTDYCHCISKITHAFWSIALI